MRDDKKFNAERDIADTRVRAIAEKFGSGFAKVEMPREVIELPTFVAVPPAPETTLDAFEAKGVGASVDEAIESWEADLNRVSPSGRFLYWRVFPEVDWSYDFQRAAVVWRVYARGALK